MIQDSSKFGAVKTDYTPEVLGTWVKVKIEFKPSHNNGFRRLWVNDQLVVNENNEVAGYSILKNKKNLLIMDIGPSPEKKFSANYQSGSLSLPDGFA